MRSHLGCTGLLDLGSLSEETQKRLEQAEASWLEYSPDPPTLEVRHVQPDDVPPLREIAGELVEFLSCLSDGERAQAPGGTFFYHDEATGQLIRMKVAAGGLLNIAWARPDYSHAEWQHFGNQPVTLVFEPFQKLNGTASFEGSSTAADDIRSILEATAGQYSQGDFEIVASIDRVQVTLHDVNADVLSVVNALRYSARNSTLTGEIDVSSFRSGDLEDYCRFVFRGDETWIARPALWSDAPETRPSPETFKQAA